MCVQNASGVTEFGALKKAMRAEPGRLVLFAFDLLCLNGRDLRSDPLLDRRRRLQDLVGVEISTRIHFSNHHVGDGPAFFRADELHGLEGIVSKRADGRYLAGRTKVWLKVKSFTVGDFQVVGVERSSTGIPVALLATTSTDPTYVGDAMLSLKAKERDAFWSDVDRLGTPKARLGGLEKRRHPGSKKGLWPG